VTRAAYVEAFAAITGRPLVKLPQMAGRSESEIFFDALALNGADVSAGGTAESLLEPFSAGLAAALQARRDDLVRDGQLLPGAAQALAAVAKLDGTDGTDGLDGADGADGADRADRAGRVVQTVLTGSSKLGAMLKLRAFDLDGFVDFDIGGYGSEAYPKGTLLRVARQRASEKHGVSFGENATVYVADSPRDVDAAKIGGARSLAVASGRASAAELREAGADAVLPDLTDTAALTELIMRLTGPG
jgi:phosphoglycolate phosphatase